MNTTAQWFTSATGSPRQAGFNNELLVSNATVSERTMLVVDDDNVFTLYAATVLEKEGYIVLVAHDAAEGLALLTRSQVGVVISDYQMPGMDGLRFLEQVRWHYPHAVRIMVSGVIDLDRLDDTIGQCAVYQFLTKPVMADTLRMTVRQAFRLWGTGLYS